MTTDPDAIHVLPDEEFAQLVGKHLHHRDGDPQVWAVLLSPRLVTRTSDLLLSMLRSAEGTALNRKRQIHQKKLECLSKGYAGRTEWLNEEALYEQWRSRNGNFQQMVQRRLGDLRSARAENARQENFDQAGVYRHSVRVLATHIQRHQALMAQSGRAPEQHDYDLWRLLDALTVPVGHEDEQATLRDALRTFWFETSAATVADGLRGRTERLMREAPAGRSPRYEGVPKVRRIDEPKRLA